MGREAGYDEWNIQIKVNPTQVLDLLNHPALYDPYTYVPFSLQSKNPKKAKSK